LRSVKCDAEEGSVVSGKNKDLIMTSGEMQEQDSVGASPSASILAVALVQFIGSAGILVAWSLFVWILIRFDRQYPNHDVLPTGVWGAFIAVPMAFSLLGVITSVGLMRLREWARRRTILLSTLPLLGGVVLALLHPPSLFPPGQISGIVLVVFVYILVFLTPISIWWLLVMTRKSVRSQFR